MRCVSVVAMTALLGLPCAASPLTAASLQSHLQSDAAGCSPLAKKLKIERAVIVGASEHNKIRRDMKMKVDGRKGQRYAAVYVRLGRQVVPINSFGPLDASAKPDDLRSLRGGDYCDVDQD